MLNIFIGFILYTLFISKVDILPRCLDKILIFFKVIELKLHKHQTLLIIAFESLRTKEDDPIKIFLVKIFLLKKKIYIIIIIK